jgi:hypothetical protein
MLLSMRLLAFISIVLAWLVYGIVSAWAGCPICLTASTPGSAETVTTHHHGDHAGMTEAAKKADRVKAPCSTDGAAHTSSCAACLVVPPPLVADAGAEHLFAYPAPAVAQALHGDRPAPQAPPPRCV